MRDYTYLGGARFSICNIFRSLRFDVDRLDLGWVDGEKPLFIRGLRIVDHDEGETVTVDGAEGDHLIYSLSYIYSKEDGAAFRDAVDAYLKIAMSEKKYLVTEQQSVAEGKPEAMEAVLH